MSNFDVKVKMPKCETTTVTIRLSKELLAEYDNLAADTNRSRNEVLVMGLEFALENKGD